MHNFGSSALEKFVVKDRNGFQYEPSSSTGVAATLKHDDDATIYARRSLRLESRAIVEGPTRGEEYPRAAVETEWSIFLKYPLFEK